MFIIRELLVALLILLSGVYNLLRLLIIARVIISFLPVDPYSGIGQFLNQATEPLLSPFRKIPHVIGMIDISPLYAFAALYLIYRLLTVFIGGLIQQLGVAY